MANTPSKRITVGGLLLQNNIGYYYFYSLFFNSISMMLTPYPLPSLRLLIPTTGGLMIASRARRRF
jgi:hypothetical protein